MDTVSKLGRPRQAHLTDYPNRCVKLPRLHGHCHHGSTPIRRFTSSRRNGYSIERGSTLRTRPTFPRSATMSRSASAIRTYSSFVPPTGNSELSTTCASIGRMNCCPTDRATSNASSSAPTTHGPSRPMAACGARREPTSVLASTERTTALSEIRLELFLNAVFVNLDPHASPLSELAGDLDQDIRRRLPFLDKVSSPRTNGLGETHIEAGWKVVVDITWNATTATMRTRRLPTSSAWTPIGRTPSRSGRANSARTSDPSNSAYEVDIDAGVAHSAFWYLWPNTTFNVMPGAEEINISAIRPTGPATTSFEGHSLAVTDDFDEDRARYTADVLVPEDIDLCESVQRGLKSMGYSQGPIIVDPSRSGRGEHALHHFHRLVQSALS